MEVIDVPDGHTWARLADPAWADPLDATFASDHGGRWTPSGGPATLYLNTDAATARANVVRFLAAAPFAPEDLDDSRGYHLVEVSLPDGQRALDALSAAGLGAVGLPPSYPLALDGAEVGHATCQPIGRRAFDHGLDGVSSRSAAGVGAEMAWFPRQQVATALRSRSFGEWYYS